MPPVSYRSDHTGPTPDLQSRVTAEEPHYCTSQCHDDDCPPCEKTHTISCQCGGTSVKTECVKFQGRGD